jgi:hypothetical protein
MASAYTWANYRTPNTNKGDDEEILSMIRDVVETIHNLERMYGTPGAQLVVRGLLQDWHTLRGIADARGLHNYERP